MKNLVQPTEVARGIYQIKLPTPFPIGDVNVYLLEGDQLTLVDTGPLTQEAWQTLNQGIKEVGYDVKDIRQVVLTHHHIDHCGLLERIRQASGAHTYAHPHAVPYVEQQSEFLDFQARFFDELYQECGVPQESLVMIDTFTKWTMTITEKSRIDAWLQHEKTLPYFPEWQVYYTPGHSQSQLSLYRAKDQVLLGGDHIIKHVSSNALIEPPLDRSRNRPLPLIQYRTALEMCATMEIDVIFPGHGEPVTDHRGLIVQRLQETWLRLKALRELLKDGEKTAYELTALLFPHAYKKELTLPLSETLGHIDLLQTLYQLNVTARNGVAYYSL